MPTLINPPMSLVLTISLGVARLSNNRQNRSTPHKPVTKTCYFPQFSLCRCEPILESRRRNFMGYNHDDPSLRTGADGLTVWTLHEMAQKKQFNELNDLFNNGLTMNSLPVGLAAGAAARVFDIDNKIIADALDALTGRNWRGKVFFPLINKKVSKGRNRMKASLLRPNAPIVPMAKFDTMLLDSHPLVPEAKSNVVILNYADLQTRRSEEHTSELQSLR